VVKVVGVSGSGIRSMHLHQVKNTLKLSVIFKFNAIRLPYAVRVVLRDYYNGAGTKSEL
jgi:hypothetical protein